MRLSRLFLGMALLLCWGCASSRTAGKKQPKSEYKTGLVQANFEVSSDSYNQTTARISYSAQTKCEGQNCVPKDARLSFYLQPGSNTIFFSDRDLFIKADKKTYQWYGQNWNDIRNSPPVLGEITSVVLKSEELAQIANAKDVSGNLAGQQLDWSFENRKPLREMMSKIIPPHSQK